MSISVAQRSLGFTATDGSFVMTQLNLHSGGAAENLDWLDGDSERIAVLHGAQ